MISTSAAAAVDFLDAHLNVHWLRPESALWDAVASRVIASQPMIAPALDLGAGNGLFSFITAQGRFSTDYDWYRNVDTRGFWENRDIYDSWNGGPGPDAIVQRPAYMINCAFDHKRNLLAQAAALGFYRSTVAGDANRRLPFGDETFQTVFSNILYWLDEPDHAFREVARVLRPGGRALLCLQDSRFKEYCTSYQWRAEGSELWRLLNRGRDESNRWVVSGDELVERAARAGLRLAERHSYLSPLTLRVWDIGLRPLSAVLIGTIQRLTEKDRREVKAEWIATARPFLEELYALDGRSQEEGGYHFAVLEKPS